MNKGIEKRGGDRRKRTGTLVKNMLKDRKRLLALLLQVSRAEHEDPRHPDPDLLREFCQVLVDYIAAGHFGLYERIASGGERRRSFAQLAADILPRIQESTEVAIAFNEKYAPDSGEMDLSRVAEDLSELGEELTTRIELEDRLIGRLHEAAEAGG